jgi:hypothetical protein
MPPAVGWQHKELPPRLLNESESIEHLSPSLLKKGVMGQGLFDEPSLAHSLMEGQSIHSLVHIQQDL